MEGGGGSYKKSSTKSSVCLVVWLYYSCHRSEHTLLVTYQLINILLQNATDHNTSGEREREAWTLLASGDEMTEVVT